MSKAAARQGAFSPVIILALVLVGVFAISAFFVLSAFAPELSRGENGRAHALSRSAVGFAAVVELLHDTGRHVSVGRNALAGDRAESFVVLTPERPITHEELRAASGAASLLILPKWAAMPDPRHRGWVAKAGLFPVELFSQLLHDTAPTLQAARREGVAPVQLQSESNAFASGPISDLQTIRADNMKPVVTDANGAIIVGAIELDEQHVLYILSDPDFLNTQGVANLETARAGLEILNELTLTDEPIIFDVTLNGLGAARSPLRLAFEPPMLGATLAIVIAGLLLGWRSMTRIGPTAPPQRAIGLGKRALADNAAALLRLNGRDKGLAPDYAAMIAAEIRKRFGRTAQDDAGLDRIGASRGVAARYSDLAAEAQRAKDVAHMLAAARKLFAWKKDVTRATR